MFAVVVTEVYAVEHIAANIGACRELRKKRKEYISAIMFMDILEVEVKICDEG